MNILNTHNVMYETSLRCMQVILNDARMKVLASI